MTKHIVGRKETAIAGVELEPTFPQRPAYRVFREELYAGRIAELSAGGFECYDRDGNYLSNLRKLETAVRIVAERDKRIEKLESALVSYGTEAGEKHKELGECLRRAAKIAADLEAAGYEVKIDVQPSKSKTQYETDESGARIAIASQLRPWKLSASVNVGRERNHANPNQTENEAENE